MLHYCFIIIGVKLINLFNRKHCDAISANYLFKVKVA